MLGRDEKRVREILLRFSSRITNYQLWPNKLGREVIEEIRKDLDLLEYLTKKRFPSSVPKYNDSKYNASFTKLVCSVCEAGLPLWNISRETGGTEWVCLKHIPKEITFPISLFGEEYLKSGRKLPKDPRDK